MIHLAGSVTGESATADAVIATDSLGQIVSWNSRAVTVFGWKEDEVVGNLLVNQIIPELNRDIFLKKLSLNLESSNNHAQDQRIHEACLTNHGKSIPVEMRASRLEIKQETYITLFVRDMSEGILSEKEFLQLAEQNLALENENLKAQMHGEDLQRYIDSMTTLSAKFSLDGHPIMINKPGQIAAGIDAETMKTVPIWDQPFCAFDKEVRSQVIEAFRIAAKGKGNRYGGCLLLNGVETPVEISFVPVNDLSGEIEYVLGEAKDISAQKEVENQLRERTLQLEASNRELEAFCYSVSHDLRAPLRAIDGYSSALKEDYADCIGEEGNGYIERIRNSVHWMSHLIDDLLNLSRLSLATIQVKELNISKIVGEIIEDLSAREPDRQVKVEIEPDLFVKADRTLLESLLLNLVGNAWKFSSKRTESHISIGQFVQKGTRVFFVKDNGVGFDMAFSNKLFGVFERLHSPKEFSGSGIGLAIAARIVERHGGRIWAESEQDKGATFFFTLGSQQP